MTVFTIGGEYPVPRIGYGAMQLAGRGVIGLPDDVDAAIGVLRSAIEQGVRFFDTANAYGPRTVNQLIGRALAPLADDISDALVIGNKVGATRGPAGEWLHDTRPEIVRMQVEDALSDMRTESSALTYLRLPGDTPQPADATVAVPLEESLGALVELRDEGKVRHIGLSGASPEMLERAQRITPIAAVQNRFNLIDRSGVEVLAACERDGIAFVPYFPLATGGWAVWTCSTGPPNAWVCRRRRSPWPGCCAAPPSSCPSRAPAQSITCVTTSRRPKYRTASPMPRSPHSPQSRTNRAQLWAPCPAGCSTRSPARSVREWMSVRRNRTNCGGGTSSAPGCAALHRHPPGYVAATVRPRWHRWSRRPARPR